MDAPCRAIPAGVGKGGPDLFDHKDRRINYCRRLLSIMVVYAAWMFSEMENL